MRLILSRKGFDSANGGAPSPIFPDGSFVSLPIPTPASAATYASILHGRQPLSLLVEALTRGKVRASSWAHLDPDLNRDALPRRRGWRPSLGQVGSAQSHLSDNRVGPGDLFLFFGWFRSVEAGTFRPVRGAADLHMLFGWLQVDRVLKIPTDPEVILAELPWLGEHPHLRALEGSDNTVYLARRTLDLGLGPMERPVSGAGLFTRFRKELVLTKPGQPKRSVWMLPRWFFPTDGRPPLSYHGDPKRWDLQPEGAQLRSVARGQEFILDCTQYPEVTPWLASLFAPTRCTA